MKRYITFWNVKLDGKPGIACGSDSRFYLDGRWSRGSAIDRARAHAEKLGKGYIGMSFGEDGPMIRLANYPPFKLHR